jgi:uncharacterized membrane protein
MGGFQRSWWFAPAFGVMATGWAAAIGLAPILGESSSLGAGLAGLTYMIGSVVCHQHADRSFHLAAVQLPVCARCTGLYIGGAIGMVTWLIWRRLRFETVAHVDAKRATLGLAITAAPTLLTVATAFAGVWDLSNAGRALLALPLGLVAGAVLSAAAANDLN